MEMPSFPFHSDTKLWRHQKQRTMMAVSIIELNIVLAWLSAQKMLAKKLNTQVLLNNLTDGSVISVELL